jgi:hypothetical protein
MVMVPTLLGMLFKHSNSRVNLQPSESERAGRSWASGFNKRFRGFLGTGKFGRKLL